MGTRVLNNVHKIVIILVNSDYMCLYYWIVSFKKIGLKHRNKNKGIKTRSTVLRLRIRNLVNLVQVTPAQMPSFLMQLNYISRYRKKMFPCRNFEKKITNDRRWCVLPLHSFCLSEPSNKNTINETNLLKKELPSFSGGITQHKDTN